jgi:hypothetical protein
MTDAPPPFPMLTAITGLNQFVVAMDKAIIEATKIINGKSSISKTFRNHPYMIWECIDRYFSLGRKKFCQNLKPRIWSLNALLTIIHNYILIFNQAHIENMSDYVGTIAARRYRLYLTEERKGRHSGCMQYVIAAILWLVKLISNSLEKVKIKSKRVIEKVTIE